MEVYGPVGAMEFPRFSGIRSFIRKNRIGRLEEWKVGRFPSMPLSILWSERMEAE